MLRQIWQCLDKLLRWRRTTTGIQMTKTPDTPSPPASIVTCTNKDDEGILAVSCRCGACTLHLTCSRRPQQEAMDCHCPSCRRYHTTAFVSYLHVVKRDVVVVLRGRQKRDDDAAAMTAWTSFRHDCAELGTVDRWFCRHCFAKLMTQPVNDDSKNQIANDVNGDRYESCYINMGSLVDDTIRADYSARWSHHRTQWQVRDPSQMAPWYPAHPDYVQSSPDLERGTIKAMTDATASQLTLRGGCACGRCRYEITDWSVPNHMSHCYCHLCRHSSGAAFASWVFCRFRAPCFRWTTTTTVPRRVRTTDIAVRYFCETCGGHLLMTYDEDHGEWAWPTVGSIDDDSWRRVATNSLLRQQEEIRTDRMGGCADGCLEDVSHIYCEDRPLWYALPDDGLPRWDE